MTLEQIVTEQKKKGLSAIEITKYVRENYSPVPFLEIKKLYMEVK
jgi:hypothetical protein